MALPLQIISKENRRFFLLQLIVFIIIFDACMCVYEFLCFYFFWIFCFGAHRPKWWRDVDKSGHSMKSFNCSAMHPEEDILPNGKLCMGFFSSFCLLPHRQLIVVARANCQTTHTHTIVFCAHSMHTEITQNNKQINNKEEEEDE